MPLTDHIVDLELLLPLWAPVLSREGQSSWLLGSLRTEVASGEGWGYHRQPSRFPNSAQNE